MSFVDVMEKVEFIGFTGDQSGNPTVIEAALSTLYNLSYYENSELKTPWKDMLDSLVLENETLVINYEEGSFFSGVGQYAMYLDLAHFSTLCYINTQGKAIAYSFTAGLAHELGHAIGGMLDDPLDDENLAGENVIFTNPTHIALSVDERLSYDGLGYNIDVINGTDYTNGQSIDAAVIVRHIANDPNRTYSDSYDSDANGHTSSSRDLLIGMSGHNDTLSSGDGNDFLYGMGGDDSLDGGSGDDQITTGIGEDVVVFDFDPEDHDTITDFTIGEDKIDLTSFGMFRADVEAAAVYSGGNTTLHLNGHEIVVQGVSKTDLFNPSNNAFIGLIEGTAGATVTGTSSNDTLNALDGATAYNDTIEGHGGNDLLYGLAGDAIHARLLRAANDNTLTPCLRRNCI